MKTSDGFVRADSRNLPKVDLPMLLAYMHENDAYNASEVRGAKILMSSRDSYVDTAVGYVEVKRENTTCTLKARITPEHKVRTKLYSVSVVLDERDEIIKDLSCEDCAASAGGCKHGICLVQWLIKRTEEPSVTSVSCYWKKPRLSEVVSSENPLRASELGKKRSFTKICTNVSIETVLEESKKRSITNSLLSNYSNNKEDSLIDYSVYNMMLKCFNADPNMTYETFKEYGQQILNSDVIGNIEKATQSQADIILWHAMRQGRVTASNAFDATRCKTPDGALVKAIMGGYKVPETKAIKRGKCLEKIVIQELKSDLNIEIKSCGLILISPILGASPDGITENFVVEIKCPSKKATIKNYIAEDGTIKEKCKCQIMLQMHAAKKSRGLFCVVDPKFEQNKMIQKIWVDYDDNFVKKLLEEAETFWETNIFNNILDCVK